VFFMNSDHELEKEMIQIFAELQKQQEKRHAKFWTEINVPFTLNDVLGKYTKMELDLIRKTLKIPNASALKKADLAALLVEKIPESLDTIVSQIDMVRFQLLIKIVKNGGRLSAPILT